MRSQHLLSLIRTHATDFKPASITVYDHAILYIIDDAGTLVERRELDAAISGDDCPYSRTKSEKQNLIEHSHLNGLAWPVGGFVFRSKST